MRNFLTVAQNVDTLPVLQALVRNSDLWDENPIRTKHPGSAHADASDILVFYNRLNSDVVNELECEPFGAWSRLPQLRPIIFGLMNQVSGVRIGRVVVTRLPPGKCITPHVDGGAPAAWYDRYQLMLQCRPGIAFRCGEETLAAKTGDLFFFDNQREHAVINNSDDDRIALIVDVRSA